MTDDAKFTSNRQTDRHTNIHTHNAAVDALFSLPSLCDYNPETETIAQRHWGGTG